MANSFLKEICKMPHHNVTRREFVSGASAAAAAPSTLRRAQAGSITGAAAIPAILLNLA
jgi:hypothetical protein